MSKPQSSQQAQSTSTQLVKVVGCDIKSQKLKTLMTNLTRFAFQNVINQLPYKERIQEASFELRDLMKIGKFKKELVLQIYNQLIRAKYEHYVVVMGSDYMLQVKYSKGSMIKFEILGQIILLYEVPYIAVPTIKDQESVSDQEYEKIKDKKEDQIKIEVKQNQVFDSNYENMPDMIQQSLKETLIWYQQNYNKHKQQDTQTKDSKPKSDPRIDNLAGVLLSRFINKQKNYHWHILFSKTQDINNKSGRVLTNHEMALKSPEKLLQQRTSLKLNMFMRIKAQFKLGEKQKEIEVIIFNQQFNPQTSVQSLFVSAFKDFSFKKIFTPNGMAILAFFCILIVFFMQKTICPDTPDEQIAALKQGLFNVDNQQGGDSPSIQSSRSDVILDEENMSDEELKHLHELHRQKIRTLQTQGSGGIMEYICSKKNSMMMNLGVAFLLLTVMRQFVIRYQSKADRIR